MGCAQLLSYVPAEMASLSAQEGSNGSKGTCRFDLVEQQRPMDGIREPAIQLLMTLVVDVSKDLPGMRIRSNAGLIDEPPIDQCPTTRRMYV